MNRHLPLAVAILLAVTSSGMAQDVAPRVAIGDRVPAFTVLQLDGKNVKWSELARDPRTGQPRPVVLTYWCSFCHSCRHMENKLEQLSRDFHGRAAIFALDASANESPEKIKAFLHGKKLALPVVLDPGGRSTQLFGVQVTTTTLVIDAQGTLRYRGRFADGDAAHAETSLKAVLAGQEVPLKETPLRG